MGRFSFESLPMSIIITIFASELRKRHNRLRFVQARFAIVFNWYPGFQQFFLLFKLISVGLMFR